MIPETLKRLNRAQPLELGRREALERVATASWFAAARPFGRFPAFATPRPAARPLPLLLMAGFLGALYTLYLFPLDYLAGVSSAFQSPSGLDWKTQIVGMRYYLGDEWRFPILRTGKIDPPDGIAIVFTDSLPLLAVLTKLLSDVFGIDWSHGGAWNYFGLWVGICYVLQAVSIVTLLLALGVRSYIVSFVAVVIALSFPAFLFRLFHITLMAHFAIILALALYFISIRSSRLAWPYFCVLAWVSLWIHAYFFVMTSAIFLGTAAQIALTRRNGWQQAGTAIGVFAVGSLGVMWASGFFWREARAIPWDIGRPREFGHYSMNVLSPFVPQMSGLFPNLSALFDAAKGPVNPAVIDATGGQYEGFAYLGAGVLLLMAAALWLDRKNVTRRARTYWGLVAVLLVLTILAVTHRVYAGGWGVTLFGQVPLVLDEIRSSGRFFLPVGYALMIAAIVIVSRQAHRSAAAALLLVAVVLQVADVGPIRDWVRTHVSQESPGDHVIAPAPWVDLIRQHDELKIVPTYACAGESRTKPAVMDLVLHASASVTPVNTIYLNRPGSVDCQAELRSAEQITVREGDLVVFLDSRYAERFAAANPEHQQLCTAFDLGPAQRGPQRQGIACSYRVPAAYRP